MEYSSVIKRNEILSFATKQMKVETIRLREINQLQKDKYIYIYIPFFVLTNRQCTKEYTVYEKNCHFEI